MKRYSLLFAIAMAVMIVIVAEARMTIYVNAGRIADLEEMRERTTDRWRKVDHEKWCDELQRLNPGLVMPPKN